MIKQFSLGLACLLLVSCGSKEEQSQRRGGQNMAVDVFVADTSNIPVRIDVPGTILPAEEVAVYSEVNGRVKQIYFSEGKRVKKGERLIQIDVDILVAQRTKLLVDLELAKKNEARKKALFDAKGISLEEYEKSYANLAAVKADIQLLDVQIAKAQIRAPFSGTIGLRHVSEGAYITTATLITTIIQDDVIKIEFSVAEKYANRVKIGQEIVFHIQDDSTKHKGIVYAYQPFVDANTRMMVIRAKLKNTSNLITGTYVSVNYDLGTINNAIMIPTECIVPVMDGQKIWLIRNGKAHAVAVEIGVRTQSQIRVIGDIQAGDTVLTTGLLAVREGMPLTIKKH